MLSASGTWGVGMHVLRRSPASGRATPRTSRSRLAWTRESRSQWITWRSSTGSPRCRTSTWLARTSKEGCVVGYFHGRELALEGVEWMSRWLDRWQEAGAKRPIDFCELAAAIGRHPSLEEDDAALR